MAPHNRISGIAGFRNSILPCGFLGWRLEEFCAQWQRLSDCDFATRIRVQNWPQKRCPCVVRCRSSRLLPRAFTKPKLLASIVFDPPPTTNQALGAKARTAMRIFRTRAQMHMRKEFQHIPRERHAWRFPDAHCLSRAQCKSRCITCRSCLKANCM